MANLLNILEEEGWRAEVELVAGGRVAVAVAVAMGIHPLLLLLVVVAEVALTGSPPSPRQ